MEFDKNFKLLQGFYPKAKINCSDEMFRSWTNNKNFDDDKQHDSSEFLLSLMEHFWKEHVYRHNTLREDLFGGISQDILTCFCGNRLDLSPQHMS